MMEHHGAQRPERLDADKAHRPTNYCLSDRLCMSCVVLAALHVWCRHRLPVMPECDRFPGPGTRCRPRLDANQTPRQLRKNFSMRPRVRRWWITATRSTSSKAFFARSRPVAGRLQDVVHFPARHRSPRGRVGNLSTSPLVDTGRNSQGARDIGVAQRPPGSIGMFHRAVVFGCSGTSHSTLFIILAGRSGCFAVP